MNISYFIYLPVRYGCYLLQVGLAVGDIDNIQKNATMDRYVTQVNFAVLRQWCTITIVNYKGKLERKTSFLFFSSTYFFSFSALVGNGRRIQDGLGFWIPRSGLRILCPRTLDSGLQSLVWPGFLDLYSGFQSPGFQISQTQFLEFQIRIPDFLSWGEHGKKMTRKEKRNALWNDQSFYHWTNICALPLATWL